jgi:hypothetical protein
MRGRKLKLFYRVGLTHLPAGTNISLPTTEQPTEQNMTTTTYTLPARKFEDFDDCLAAACEEIAKKLDVELWQTNARWDDEMRDAVVVTVHGN